MQRHILILGGTTEARELGERLAPRTDIAVTLSLAGRTLAPRPQPVPTRRGGFGGTTGLVQYLIDHAIAAVIDATHPFAAIMSAHAASAAAETQVPLVALCRPAWSAVEGDRWCEVDNTEDAVEALGLEPRRVLLAIGRQEVAAFDAAPQHSYLIRTVDPVEPTLRVPDARYFLDRGPFDPAREYELLRDNAIDVIVAKNSGGDAGYGKISAARALGLQVILLRRPPPPAACSVSSVEAVLDWLDHVLQSPSDRGV